MLSSLILSLTLLACPLFSLQEVSALSSHTPPTMPASADKGMIIGQKPAVAAVLLEQSGVGSQLSAVLDLVLTEQRFAASSCNPDDAEIARHRQSLSVELAPLALRKEAIGQLSRLLDSETLQVALNWYRSPAGVLIRKVEKASADLRDHQVSTDMTEYLGSMPWTEKRRALISKMLAATQTAEFVTAFNTGVLTLVEVASRCQVESSVLSVAAVESLKESGVAAGKGASNAPLPLENTIDIIDQFDWYDRQISQIVAMEITPVSATLLRDVSDRHLRSLIDFADSERGSAFHNALVESTIRVLKSKVRLLREKIPVVIRSAEGEAR